MIASPERKGRLKGTRSSSSTDTGGSDSKEPDKSLVQKKAMSLKVETVINMVLLVLMLNRGMMENTHCKGILIRVQI